ncbi:MAG: GNAT family N-acetyltransferase [Lachnospiraceae bacterium]|jgi:RimJ/RimL family protein N-acetyltransferase|nr:GNAT family N-acetyltransferase [Lachnospiraceae bacterium]
MVLTTIVIAMGIDNDSKEMKEFARRIAETYSVVLCPLVGTEEELEDELYSFFRRHQLSKSQVLFLAKSRRLLLYARELNVATLACKMDEVEDFHGFPLVCEQVWEVDLRFLLRCYQREWEQPWFILETEHLYVREENEEDLDAIYPMYDQPHIAQFLERPYENRRDEVDYMQKYRKYVYGYYQYGLWHVIDKATGQSVGRAGMNPKTYADGKAGAELGYMIAEPFTKRGYCMEVCRAILEYAKTELYLTEVFCLIRPDNEVSVHVAEKLGFSFDAEIESEGRKMLRFYKEL